MQPICVIRACRFASQQQKRFASRLFALKTLVKSNGNPDWAEGASGKNHPKGAFAVPFSTLRPKLTTEGKIGTGPKPVVICGAPELGK
jgi:hypothetical protein